MTEENIYTRNGYEDRDDYLETLAYENDVSLNDVVQLSNLLGEEEDFDGLVSMVQDMSMGI